MGTALAWAAAHQLLSPEEEAARRRKEIEDLQREGIPWAETAKAFVPEPIKAGFNYAKGLSLSLRPLSMVSSTPSTTLPPPGQGPVTEPPPAPEWGKLAPVVDLSGVQQSTLPGYLTQRQVPPGDVEKFFASRRGKSDERFPQMPSDPRAISELNQYLDRSQLEHGQFELQRARLEQGRQAAEINPQTRETSELGVLASQAAMQEGQAGLFGAQAGRMAQTPVQEALRRNYIPTVEMVMSDPGYGFQLDIEGAALALQDAKAGLLRLPPGTTLQTLPPEVKAAYRRKAAIGLAMTLDPALQARAVQSMMSPYGYTPQY